jgi:hypothetical protein
MALRSLNLLRVRSVTPSVATSGAMLLILALFISNVEAWKPATFFGRYQDDAVYFSSAQALAQHQGYVLPSFPGKPSRPKYPILYPLLLSGVWKLWPEFPNNLIWAIRLTEAFGCLALLCTFFLLRCVAGIGRVASLILTAICAFHPVLLRLSGLTMSDVPFAAMLLFTILLARFAVVQGVSRLLVAALGIAAALSASLRTIGYVVVVGLLAYILRYREYRRAVVYSLAAAATSGSILLLTAHNAPFSADLKIRLDSTSPQWERLVAFYTDYVGFQWRMGIPTVGSFFTMVRENCLQLVSSPGPFLAGAFDRHSWLLTAGMSAIVLSGVVRELVRREWQPVMFVAIPYMFVVILWPFPIMERFLLPFLPLFLVATILESKRLLSLAMTNFRPHTSLGKRILAAGICVILLGYATFSGWTYLFRDRRQLREAEEAQTKTLQQKKEVYSWIRDHTPASAKIVAYDDVLLFLYSRRQALRPIAILPTAAYSKGVGSIFPDLAQDLAHMSDAPRHAGATYWLVTEDDFSLEAEREKITTRQNEIAAALPIVFRSSEGFATLHDSSCLLAAAAREDCKSVKAVLFPTDR